MKMRCFGVRCDGRKGAADRTTRSLGKRLSQRLVPQMSELVAAFISELLRSANEVERLGNHERCRLLRRAAITIQDHGVQIGSGPSEGGIVDDLNYMADSIDLHGSKEVSVMMLDAIAVIKAG